MIKSGCKILIVEDENIARMYLKTILSKTIKEIYTASNGKEGLELFVKIKPDLIITDLEMPIMDGIEMVKQIRKTNMKIPIIVTTAYNDDEHKIDNVQGRVLKPIIINEMISKINDLLHLNKFWLKKINK